MLIQFTQNYQN